MKTIIIALAMISSSAFAWSTDYGPGSYTKTVKVCYKSGDRDCRMNKYRYYKPRMERVCYKNGSGESETCFNRMTTGNYGSFKGTRAEREAFDREGRN